MIQNILQVMALLSQQCWEVNWKMSSANTWGHNFSMRTIRWRAQNSMERCCLLDQAVRFLPISTAPYFTPFGDFQLYSFADIKS